MSSVLGKLSNFDQDDANITQFSLGAKFKVNITTAHNVIDHLQNTGPHVM